MSFGRMGRVVWLGAVLSVSLNASLLVAQKEEGGRDVSISLFSAHAVHGVRLEPVLAPASGGSEAWTAGCRRCPHQPLKAPMHVAGAMEIFAGGLLRVTDDVTGEARTATGLWHLRGASADGSVDVVATIPSERYVAAVLNAEAASDEPAQSLRALAILARTYALNGQHYAAAAGHLAADLCDSTQCEAMQLRTPPATIEAAVRATAGETLWFGGRRAEVFFSQSCGGQTEAAGAVWSRLRGIPYLPSHADPYCVKRDAAAWHAEVPLAALASIAKAEGWHLPEEIVAAQVAKRSGSRRALTVRFSGRNGVPAVVAASALRFGIGRALGWNQVRSDAYEVGVRHGALVFDGRGHGHGVGLCQAGATEMAREGKGTREILSFYFPGTAVRILPGDAGWQEVQAGGLTVRSAEMPTEVRRQELEHLWMEAQKRFPPRKTMAPVVEFAPSTELFRQMTAQPGWMLASTRGNTVVLQPEAVLRAGGRDEAATLRHELLHVLVESECAERTPLWLREGMVEVLAGEAGNGSKMLPVGEIEAALRHPGSQAESERAHRAAAARVRELIVRYGSPAVRGWLSSGVPAGVV